MTKQREQSPDEGMTPEDFEKALSELTPEQAEMFTKALELAMRKRRVLLLGYLSALLALIIGIVGALYIYGTREPGTFVGWVFLVPLATAGALMLVFGRISRSIK